ncbi:MAG TPA: copper homeostasis protein CutC [Candidatus Angelobacter sp.]|nr:copper homeostasis protein CutC [Candidatus Angelobacter sp.]
MSQPGFVLEVIACTVADAIEAEKGGADRLEVISHFERGGLTPSMELVRAIRSAVRLPLRVMLRESDGYQVASNDEVERLCSTAQQLAALRVDGVVLGFLRDGKVDIELTRHILESAPAVNATFHHAFDETIDPFQALTDLRQCGQIDRVLTSGGPGNWADKIDRLARYQQATGGHPIILVGGGVDASVLKAICTKTNLAEFHIGRAVRVPAAVNGSVQSARVNELVACLGGPEA